MHNTEIAVPNFCIIKMTEKKTRNVYDLKGMKRNSSL